MHLGEPKFCCFIVVSNLFVVVKVYFAYVVVKVYFAYDNFFVYGSEHQFIYLTLCHKRPKPKRP